MCWAKGIFTFAKGVSSVFQNLLQTDLQLVENGKGGGRRLQLLYKANRYYLIVNKILWKCALS